MPPTPFWRMAASALFLLPAALPGALLPSVVPLGPATQWSKAEFLIKDAPTAENNFDPDQIAMDATLVAPSGASMTVPAFWYQGFARGAADPGKAAQDGLAAEPACWRLRCTPTEPGEYRLTLHWSVAGKDAPESVSAAFSVAAAPPSAPAGWVRVGPGRRYFETSDGRPLRLIGENVCWPDRTENDYGPWFASMAAAGENFARIWLCPWWAGLEHVPGTLNRYPLAEAWKLDQVFDLADRNGIYLLLCLDHHGMYQVDNKSWGGKNNFWATNPYSKVQGGPCENPNDFFTDPAARRIYEKRLRYVVARYGYSRRLLAWQFFNEIDNVFTRGLNGPDVIAWHRDLGQWLRAHDPYGHLITTSLTGGSDRPEMWELPEMDFTDYHSYSDPALGRKIAALSEDFHRRYGRPVLIDEFGVSAASWSLASDPYLRGFRQALWSGALGGSVGTSMSWWWQDIDKDGAYTLYATLSKVLGDAGWRDGAWEPARVASPSETPAVLGRAGPGARTFDAVLALNTGRRLRLSGVAAIASPLAAERSSEQLSRFIYGGRNADLPHSMTLLADFAAKGMLLVSVASAASDNEVVIRVDGAEVLRKRVARSAAPADADRSLAVPLQPGQRTIEIANVGDDFTQLDSVRLERVVEAGFEGGWDFEPEVAALRSGTRAIVYVTSPWSVYPAGALRYSTPLVSGKSVTLMSWAGGPVGARWYSPIDGTRVGSTTGRVDGGEARIPIPDFRDDLVGVVGPP